MANLGTTSRPDASSWVSLANERKATLNVSQVVQRVVKCMLDEASNVSPFVTNREASGPSCSTGVTG